MRRTGCLLLLLLLWPTHPLSAQQKARVELPYRGGTVVIEADQITRESAVKHIAEGNVVVTYQDTTLKSRRLIYEADRELVTAEEDVEITRGVQWLKGTAGEFNLSDGTGRIENAEGFTDEQLFVKAKTLLKTGPDTYKARDGLLTACDELIPKWSFKINRATIRVNGRATVKNTIFRVKKLPLFYIPYLSFPTAKRERSTGFLLPSSGNSNNKGRRFSQEFFLALGRSTDFLFREDYFSERGFGHGVTFRTRPDNYSYLHLEAYTINDRQNQGGTSLVGEGQTRFGNGYRMVADFNLVSNFVFRRVFADSFYQATRPSEESRVFVTNNFGNKSFNFRMARQETIFPRRNVVTRHAPSISFRVTGQRIGHTPLFFDLDSSAAGVGRSDDLVETPSITQRLDIYPRFYFSLPVGQGLRITPRIAVRQTFYSDRLQEDEEGNRSVVSDNLNRRYFDFTLDLKGWGLSKIYQRPDGTRSKHLIEPELRYRYTNGIDEANQVIRFDENDAIANTNEFEYSLVNRFFVKRRVQGGETVHEWLSIRVGQKYFFDSDFGGALRSGFSNQFFPLYSFTGFPYGSLPRNYSPLTTALRWSPSRRVSFDLRGDYDPDFNRFRNLSITGFLYKRGFGFATSYFVTQQLEPGTIEQNQLQGSVYWGNLNRGLSLSTLFTYDARNREFLNSRSRINYFWDCCGVSMEFQRINVGLREESQFRFSVFLKGLGSFGTIRRPDRYF